MTQITREPTASTADRICETALALFNEIGFDRVPLYRIASELNISPGNLTYHFRKRQDVVDRLVDEFVERFSAVLATPSAEAPEAMATYLHQLYGVIWDYRFIFTSFEALIHDDRTREAHVDIAKRAIDRTRTQMDYAIATGSMRPVRPPTTTELLAANMWASWLHTICFSPLLTGRPPESRRAAVIEETFVRHIATFQPYSSSAFIAALMEAGVDVREKAARARLV